MPINSMYLPAQLENAGQRLANIEQERQQRLDNDPVVVTARRKLEKAQGDYEQLQSQTRTMPYKERVKWLGDIKVSEEAIANASRELQTAINSNSSAAYVAKLQQEQAEKAKQQAATQAQYAAEQEAEAKKEYKLHYINAGGRDFESAWPEIWAKMVQTRAAEQHAKLQLQLKTGYTL